ncbi:hypothetical protein Herbaro_21735 [Herbaspirillum sp. WKF16]|jgi:hypothetical protein|uniref:hypothetical protein n=1 Tax=Herbaspirillum sp. WKF16 TaxID=3028312 RepID=UPI0023A93D57|nr:hypothetical protein [Herbaspirillum sp. WKF16]WDZ96066.1 hypothetical protein Herbaro_21735 [Herbaspirillum sp. WKF16]
MTSFLRTRKDRHPKHDKPRLPHEHDQSFDRQDAARSGHKVERQEIRHAYNDIREGQVDTDLRGTGGLDEANKAPGRRSAGAPPKEPDEG